MSERKSSTHKPLQGIVPPLVTPLTDRDTIDEKGTQRLLEHVISGGVAGVFILDTPGPTPASVRGLPFNNQRRPWFPRDAEMKSYEPMILRGD